MKFLTPQITLVLAAIVFIFLFLLPSFSTTLEYSAWQWTNSETGEPVNLLTDSITDLDLNSLSLEKVNKSGEVGWAGIDFGLTGVSSPLANFKRGSGLYESYKVTYQAGFHDFDVFPRDVNLIRRRISAANLSDVTLETEVDAVGEERDRVATVSLTFPENYGRQEAEIVASILMSPGEISFFEQDPEATTTDTADDAEQSQSDFLYQQLLPGFTPKQAQIGPNDIAAVQVVNRTEYLAPVWQITFTESSRERVFAVLRRLGVEPETDSVNNGTVSRNLPVMALEIDGIPQFVLLFEQGLNFVGVPLGILSTANEIRTASSFIISNSIVSSSFSQLDLVEQDNLFALDGRAFLAWMIILIVGFTTYATFRKFGTRGVFAAGLAVSLGLGLGFAVLKFVANPISLGMILAFSISAVLIWTLIMSAIRKGKDNIEASINSAQQLAGLLFGLSCLMYLTNIGFGLFQDMMGSLAILTAAIFITVWAAWKVIFDWYFKV